MKELQSDSEMYLLIALGTFVFLTALYFLEKFIDAKEQVDLEQESKDKFNQKFFDDLWDESEQYK